MSEKPDRVRMDLSVEDAALVAEALSYWVSASDENFGAGYERGSAEDAAAREAHRRVSRITDRLVTRLEVRGW